VQFFAKRPLMMPEEFKQSKIFVWAGDNPIVDIYKSLGYHPVVLELNDILPGLQTGMIDVIPVAPMFALAGQFDRSAQHMLHMNWVPIVGATIITRKTWDAMSPAVREAVTVASAKAARELRMHRDTLDENSIKAMQKRGLQVQAATPEVENAWRTIAQTTYPKIRGTMVPADMFDRVEQLLTEYRDSKK
jgi:TRAP-type C4-dicarboxylate transport system substrate-binding protein